MFGLDMMALAWTYLPPTWLITSAYWLSAPTATILPPPDAALAPPEHAATAVAATAAATASSRMPHGPLAGDHAAPGLLLLVLPRCRAWPRSSPSPRPGQISARFGVNDNRFYYQ